MAVMMEGECYAIWDGRDGEIHSALGMRTRIEFEKMHTYPSEVA